MFHNQAKIFWVVFVLVYLSLPAYYLIQREEIKKQKTCKSICKALSFNLIRIRCKLYNNIILLNLLRKYFI